jgi:glycosyltransferase involved in cell wall biosynthesis
VISVVIESWNVDAATDPLARLLASLSNQVAGAEVVVTHAGITAETRAALDHVLGQPIRWLELPTSAGYYDHKNRGFDASTGDIVAFIDGDCTPVDDWLAQLTAPFAHGGRVVAGATSYAGALATLANQIDFPYWDAHARRATIEDAPPTVRNFFANNVAFARDVFAAHHYPTIEPMFHGQCQVLGLQLLAEHIAVRFAAGARVTHAWPDGLRDLLAVRLLRGADTVSLLPYVLRTYAPSTVPTIEKLGALPTLALFGARAVSATRTALRRGPLVRGLAFVALSTVLDAIGAIAHPAVHRYLS